MVTLAQGDYRFFLIALPIATVAYLTARYLRRRRK